MYTKIFIALFLISAPTWKQPNGRRDKYIVVHLYREIARYNENESTTAKYTYCYTDQQGYTLEAHGWAKKQCMKDTTVGFYSY